MASSGSASTHRQPSAYQAARPERAAAGGDALAHTAAVGASSRVRTCNEISLCTLYCAHARHAAPRGPACAAFSSSCRRSGQRAGAAGGTTLSHSISCTIHGPQRKLDPPLLCVPTPCRSGPRGGPRSRRCRRRHRPTPALCTASLATPSPGAPLQQVPPPGAVPTLHSHCRHPE